jgi:C-3',4' desaturase CrtD
MAYEVVVVGGGIGGLTTAALLAARGLNVCLLERQSSVGGCLTPFEKFGYSFETGAGLYALWSPGEIHDRIFSELPVSPPLVRKSEPAYVVRMPDRTEIAITSNQDELFQNLRTGFPECAEEAVVFFQEAEATGKVLLAALEGVAAPPRGRLNQKLHDFFPEVVRANDLVSDTTLQHLKHLPLRFRRFIDAQLQTFGQGSAAECSYLYACVLVAVLRRGLFSIQGGGASLAESLAGAIRKSGGTLRLDTSALRLAYDSAGRVTGVHLLTGETVTATRAVVSNLTIWDTFGKLVGLDRTPSDVRRRLKNLVSGGVYQLLLGLGETQAQKLNAEHIIALTDLQEEESYNPSETQLTFAMSPAWDTRAPQGMRAATVTVPTDVNDWFTYHVDETEHEQQDQATLEGVWTRLASVLPELGDSVELIETATPRTWYELTRRKLGMVGGLPATPGQFGPDSFGPETPFENLFLVGDTIFPGAGVAAVSHGALILANHLSTSR